MPPPPDHQPPDTAGDPAPRPSRRSFTPEYKLAIVTEYENASHGEKGAILRREGLYSSHVIEWTKARDAGATDRLDRRPNRIDQADKDDKVQPGHRTGKTSAPQRRPGSRTRHDPDHAGHHGKSARALGTTVREHARRHATQEIMTTAFTQLRAANVPITTACALTGRSRATHYRHTNPAPGRRTGPRPPRSPPPQALDDHERQRVLDLLASPAYADLAIPQVWARELDEGRC
jgi:transposase-like protein